MAVIRFHYSINKPTSFLLTKKKDEIRGSIKASIQSKKMYQVSNCDPFLKKKERVVCENRRWKWRLSWYHARCIRTCSKT
jgi:hypothetical protein